MVVQARCWWPVCSCPEPSPTPSPAPFPRPQVLGEPSSEGDLIGSTEAALACRAFCRGQVSSQLTCPASGPLGIFNCIFLSVQSCPATGIISPMFFLYLRWSIDMKLHITLKSL